jgi:hypothetical protein
MVKRYRRAVRHERDRIINEFWSVVMGLGFRARLRIAWAIVKGAKR